GSSTSYISSMAVRYADLVGALPVSMRDSVDGARPSFSATSSSLSECPSRRRRSSAPRRRRRTVGPRGTRNSPPREACGGQQPGSSRRKPDATRYEHQTVTGPLRTVPDKQYDTALTRWMKSHPGSQLRNFLHALAPRGLAPPSSVLVPV